MHTPTQHNDRSSRRFASTRVNGWSTCMFTATPVVLATLANEVVANAKSIHPRGSDGFPMEGNS